MDDDRTPDQRATPDADRDDAPSHRVTAVEVVWNNVWVRAISYVVLAVLLIFVLWRLRTGYAFALQVGVIGFVIAYIFNPLVELLGRIRIRRALAVFLVYLLVLLLIVLGSVLLGQVVVELTQFAESIDTAFNTIGGWVQGVSNWLSGLADRLPAVLRDRFGVESGGDELSLQIQEQIADFLTRATTGLIAFLERLVTGGPTLLLTGANRIISTTLQIFLILLASAYFLYDFPRFVENFRRFVPVRWRPLYRNLSGKADQAVGGYLRGQLLITSVLGLLIFLGLTILDVRLALAISFLAAIFNLVPFLGPIIGVIPAVLLALIDSPWKALGVVVVFIIANQLEGNLLSPMILSRSVNLHPVTVLLAIMVGVGLLGFVGALLAVPFVALVKVVLEEFLFTRPAYDVDLKQGDGDGEADGATVPDRG
jgi:predicted PurR-regulated permease PerM